PEPLRTPMALAMALGEAASRHTVPCGGVGCAAWSLAEAVGRVWARRRQDWMHLRKQNRVLATASVHRREANGGALQRPRPPSAGEARDTPPPAPPERPALI